MSALYNRDILALAASTATLTRLANPSVTIERRSPLCGSRVTIDLAIDDEGRIADIGGEVRACALGQAATALLANAIRGRHCDDVIAASTRLTDYLAQTVNTPGDWPGLEIFAAARPHRARHASIRLAFEAAADAAHHRLSMART